MKLKNHRMIKLKSCDSLVHPAVLRDPELHTCSFLHASLTFPVLEKLQPCNSRGSLVLQENLCVVFFWNYFVAFFLVLFTFVVVKKIQLSSLQQCYSGGLLQSSVN